MARGDLILVKLTVDKRLELDVIGFDLREDMSQVPTYLVTVLDQSSKLDAFVGKSCSLAFAQNVYVTQTPRDFCGLIMAAQRSLDGDGSAVLNLEIRPTLAVLGLSVHSAIYQKKTSVDILKDVLARNGLPRIKIEGTKPTTKRDTVIQYNENDLAFCRRILAEEGLAFYYHDGKSPETLMIHDVRKPFPKGFAQIKLTDADMSDVTQVAATSLNIRRQLRPDRVELTHYDPVKADMALSGTSPSSEAKTPETPSVLEYRHVTIGDLKLDELKVLANAVQAPELALTGECQHPAMHLGQEISVISTGMPELAGRYIIVGLRYTPARGNALSCQFQAMPISHVPAPERLPKPLMAGVHSAIVCGPSGAKAGDAACDDQGRVQVRFFWDKASETSGYIRVAEVYAGKGYGSQFIPRVGHEVLVSFLHGDPDAPVITGQIYTEKHKPPFIEKNTTRSGIRSQLAGKANELEFDDKKGAELIGLRAAKDYELIVQENVLRDIKKLDTTKIGETCKVDIGKNWDITVTQTQTNKAKDRVSKITDADKVDAKEITLTGKSKITLKVGSSKIELTPTGIIIDAMKVEIKGKTKVDVKSAASLALSGLTSTLEAKTALNLKGLNIAAKGSVMAKIEAPMAEVSGQGMLTLKGAITMIN